MRLRAHASAPQLPRYLWKEGDGFFADFKRRFFGKYCGFSTLQLQGLGVSPAPGPRSCRGRASLTLAVRRVHGAVLERTTLSYYTEDPRVAPQVQSRGTFDVRGSVIGAPKSQRGKFRHCIRIDLQRRDEHQRRKCASAVGRASTM